MPDYINSIVNKAITELENAIVHDLSIGQAITTLRDAISVVSEKDGQTIAGLNSELDARPTREDQLELEAKLRGTRGALALAEAEVTELKLLLRESRAFLVFLDGINSQNDSFLHSKASGHLSILIDKLYIY